MTKSNWLIFSSALIGSTSVAGAVQAQDMVSSYVDFGVGSYRDVDYSYVIGSARVRTDSPFSFQIDAMAGAMDGDFAGGLTTHGIWELDDNWQIGAFATAMKSDAGGGSTAKQIGLEGVYSSGSYEVLGYFGQQYDFQEGTFGGIAITAFPFEDLSVGIEHSFDSVTDGTTSLSLEKRFGSASNSYSLYTNAGYVHDTEKWSVEAGFRIYFGNSSRRDFVSRGFSGSAVSPRMMPNQFRNFMQAAAKQTQVYNDTVVE